MIGFLGIGLCEKNVNCVAWQSICVVGQSIWQSNMRRMAVYLRRMAVNLRRMAVLQQIYTFSSSPGVFFKKLQRKRTETTFPKEKKRDRASTPGICARVVVSC